MVGQSDWLPMMIPIAGSWLIFRPVLPFLKRLAIGKGARKGNGLARRSLGDGQAYRSFR